MDWTQAMTVIGVLGGFTFWLFTKLDSDIKKVDSEMRSSHHRIDQLYQMFIDLIKEKK